MLGSVNPRGAFARVLMVVFAFILASAGSSDAARLRNSTSQQGNLANENTIAVISGNLNATYISIAFDLSAVLDDGNNFRVLPIVGKGGWQNLRDVRFLKGVDLGITQANLMNRMRRTGEIGAIDDKFTYIAKLFNEEMHLVVRAESGITSINQLNGKRVNFSDVGSGTQMSTRDIFERLGIRATEVNMPQNDAFEALKRGEIAATVLIAGKPTGSTAKLRATDGWRLLPVDYADVLHEDYLPTTLTHNDYPGLIEPGAKVETLAVSAILFAYNWPKNTDRYRRIRRFVDEFFPRLADFQKPPRHPKWRETNLAATLPGWKRFDAAEEWLAKNRAAATANAGDDTRVRFDRFLAQRGVAGGQASMTPEQREALFKEFVNWNRRQERR
jgi:TRAP transporter TAXI family solute receptor